MKTIAKVFATLKEAEDFQFDLYSKYNNVKLVKSPFLSEHGTYQWKVSDPI